MVNSRAKLLDRQVLEVSNLVNVRAVAKLFVITVEVGGARVEILGLHSQVEVGQKGIEIILTDKLQLVFFNEFCGFLVHEQPIAIGIDVGEHRLGAVFNRFDPIPSLES